MTNHICTYVKSYCTARVRATRSHFALLPILYHMTTSFSTQRPLYELGTVLPRVSECLPTSKSTSTSTTYTTFLIPPSVATCSQLMASETACTANCLDTASSSRGSHDSPLESGQLTDAVQQLSRYAGIRRIAIRLSYTLHSEGSGQDSMSHWEAEYAAALKELKESDACNAALLRTVLANQRALVCTRST